MGCPVQNLWKGQHPRTNCSHSKGFHHFGKDWSFYQTKSYRSWQRDEQTMCDFNCFKSCKGILCFFPFLPGTPNVFHKQDHGPILPTPPVVVLPPPSLVISGAMCSGPKEELLSRDNWLASTKGNFLPGQWRRTGTSVPRCVPSQWPSCYLTGTVGPS